MSNIKKLLGIGHRVKPVLMEDVKPAPQDPQAEARVQDAVGSLVGSLIALERRSYLLRKELSNMSLSIVAQPHKRAKDT